MFNLAVTQMACLLRGQASPLIGGEYNTAFLERRFLRNKADTQHYNDMVDMHNAVVADADQAQEPKARDTLIKLKWSLQVWIHNVEAYYTTFKWKLEQPVANFNPRTLKSSNKGYFFEPASSTEGLPVCEYSLDTKRVFFPQSNDYRGQIGTVLFKMDVDEDGKVSNAVPLSSVPEERLFYVDGYVG